jgi:hypothetical protein
VAAELFLELGPPHMAVAAFPGIEEAFDDLICLANVNRMNANTLLMFNKAHKCITPVSWTCQTQIFCFLSIIPGHKLHEEKGSFPIFPFSVFILELIRFSSL